VGNFLETDNNKRDQKTIPFVSVIMPVRNESLYIERSLGAVLKQDYPHDLMEILIVDGMSTDLTRHKISHITENIDITVTVLDNPTLIVPAGMNIAIRRAKGDVIIRVDGHTIIETDYVRQCVEILERTGADNVGGPMRAIGDGYVTKGISIATSTPFGLGDSQFHYSDQEQFVDTVYMGAFRKEALTRVGFFDENFVRHQDYELNFRIRKSGGKIFLSPKIRSRYYVRDSLKKLWRQYFQYGYWKGKLLQRSPDSLKWRHLVPPIFVLMLFLAIISSTFSNEGRIFLILLIGIYGCFLIIASFMARRFGNRKYASILPVIFAGIHFSWGIGVWFGLLSKKLPDSIN
jgi:cellulose synthase/poly-beta-1,6-N-acetylglucosamine synthase-like glycosyltransferase